jgi:GTP-binding protein
MLVSSLDDDPYRGRLALGRVQRGTLTRGQDVVVATANGWSGRQAITGILVWRGLHQIEVAEATVGDIVAVFGLPDVNIGDSICAADSPEALPRIEVGDPTLRMQFTVNTSPFAGREQKLSSTSRQLRARLDKELRTNVALRVADGATADGFEVSGRGELHLAILIETMRREGFEFEVSRPQVITKEKNGTKLEPVEECVIDVQQSYLGAVTELLGARGAVMQSLRTDAGGGMRLIYHAPTRALIGVRSTLLTLTRGTGVMATRLLGWEPWRFLPRAHRMGVLTASQPGMAVAYGLLTLQERGQPLIGPGTPVYEGMVVGMNRRPGDLAVNVAKQKQKTNIRSSTSDFTVTLTPPRTLSLEEALDFIQDDELVEVTPSSLRLRKRVLNANDRNAIRKREALRT